MRFGGVEGNIMRNLVAFEQCNFGTTHHMTSYFLLMHSLIRLSKDAELLRWSNVIHDSTSNKDVLNYNTTICQGIVPKDVHFSSLCAHTYEYKKSYWNSYWNKYHNLTASVKAWSTESVVTLKHDYFQNMWTTSVIAAVVLLLLTGLQTFYSILSY